MSATRSTALPPEVHPAPHADRVPGWMLLLGLGLAPLAWFVQLGVDTFVGSNACYPRDEPLTMPALPLAGPFAASDLVALALGVLGFFLAWSAWRRSRGERSGNAHRAIATGDGRTRFLGMSGMISSGMVLFAMAVAAWAHLVLAMCGT